MCRDGDRLARARVPRPPGSGTPDLEDAEVPQLDPPASHQGPRDLVDGPLDHLLEVDPVG